MPAINEVQGASAEIVIQERVVTNEYRVVEIHENIRDRFVRAEVELGPFVTEERPNGRSFTRASGRRGIEVWRDDEYDAIRDTWSNADLMAAVAQKING